MDHTYAISTVSHQFDNKDYSVICDCDHPSTSDNSGVRASTTEIQTTEWIHNDDYRNFGHRNHYKYELKRYDEHQTNRQIKQYSNGWNRNNSELRSAFHQASYSHPVPLLKSSINRLTTERRPITVIKKSPLSKHKEVMETKLLTLGTFSSHAKLNGKGRLFVPLVDACDPANKLPAEEERSMHTRLVEDTIILQRTNRKYRRQHQSLTALVGKRAVFCAVCRMQYFYPESVLHKYVYWVSAGGRAVPYFSCKVCGMTTHLNDDE